MNRELQSLKAEALDLAKQWRGFANSADWLPGCARVAELFREAAGLMEQNAVSDDDFTLSTPAGAACVRRMLKASRLYDLACAEAFRARWEYMAAQVKKSGDPA